MTTREITVVFTRATPVTLAYEPGDLAILSREEAARVISAGVAVPGVLVYDAPRTKEAKP